MNDPTTARPNPDSDRPWCRQSQGTVEIVKAVCAVMSAVTAVKKGSRNKFQNYDYASDADILFALQPELAANGLCWRCVWVGRVHDIIQAKMEHRTRIDAVYRLHHQSGEWMDYAVAGEGADNVDKGVYKALTGAYKYLQRQAFALPTGDDPEKGTRKPAKKRTAKKPPPKPPETWEDVRDQWVFDPITIKDHTIEITLEGHVVPFLRSTGTSHPVDMQPDRRTKILQRLKNGGRAALAAFVEKTMGEMRSAFYGAFGKLHPKPTKRDHGDAWDLAKTAHDALAVAVKQRLWGVDSLNDVTPEQALGERGIAWIRGEPAAFEAVVQEVDGD